jgi:hypothetical protein
MLRRKLEWLLSRTVRKTAALRGTGLVLSAPDPSRSEMTQTQKLFLECNAERLGVSLEESKRRYDASWASIPGGHSGRAFREFRRVDYSGFRFFATMSRAPCSRSTASTTRCTFSRC